MPLCGSKEARLAVGESSPREFHLQTRVPEVKSVFNSFTLQRPDLSKELATNKYGGRVLGPYSYEGATQPRPWLTERDLKQPHSMFASRRPRIGEDWAGAFRPPSTDLDFLQEPPRRQSALQPPGGFAAAPGAYGQSWPEAVEAPPPPRDHGLDLLSDALYRPDGSVVEAALASGLNYSHSFHSSQSRLHPTPTLCAGQQIFHTIPPEATNSIHVRDAKRTSATFRVAKPVRPHRSKYLPEPFGGAWVTPPPPPPRKPAKRKKAPASLGSSASLPTLSTSASVPQWSFAPTRVSDRFEVRPSTDALQIPSYSDIYR